MLIKCSFSYLHTLNTVNYSLKFKTYFLFILTHTKFVNQWLSRVPNIQCDICEVLSHRSVMSDLGNLIDYSPPGSSVHGILQPIILKWVAIPFSRGSTQGQNPGLLHYRQILYRMSHQGSPNIQSHLSFNLDFKSKICE